MMGRTHALTGWCAGLALAPLVDLNTVAEAVVFAAATAGYALLPDLDHPSSRASRLLGPVTGLVSRALRAASSALYRATRGPRDERGSGTHRHMTHTLLWAGLLGVLVAVGTSAGGPCATLCRTCDGRSFLHLLTPVALDEVVGGISDNLTDGNQPITNASSGQVRSQRVRGRAVEVAARAVITASGARVLVPGEVLHVAQG